MICKTSTGQCISHHHHTGSLIVQLIARLTAVVGVVVLESGCSRTDAGARDVAATLTPVSCSLSESAPGTRQAVKFKLQTFHEAIDILDVSSSCGCTKPSIAVAHLDAGKSVDVSVDFRNPDTPQMFGHRIFVTARGRDSGVTMVLEATLSGRCIWPLYSSPQEFALSEVLANQPQLLSIELCGKDAANFVVDTVECASRGLAETTISGNRIKVMFTPPQGSFRTALRIKTNCKTRPEIDIPVHGFGVAANGFIKPSRLSLGVVRENTEVNRCIAIAVAKNPTVLLFPADSGWRGSVETAAPGRTETGKYVAYTLRVLVPNTVAGIQ